MIESSDLCACKGYLVLLTLSFPDSGYIWAGCYFRTRLGAGSNLVCCLLRAPRQFLGHCVVAVIRPGTLFQAQTPWDSAFFRSILTLCLFPFLLCFFALVRIWCGVSRSCGRWVTVTRLSACS
ncbi:hypothetical protein BDW72DRAFT_32767 [Aspergillus terricola var. indicus]